METGLITKETKFKVEFYDVDAMNIVWHGNYVKYMELGRCDLLDSIGYGYLQMVETGYSFPVIGINLKYIRSLKFRETATIRSTLIEYENRIRIKYEIYNEKGELTTKAESTQMALNMATNESEFVCPKVFTDKVEKILNNK